MSNLTYLFATFLLIVWAVGFFMFGIGSSIHVVLAFALMLFVLRILNGKKQDATEY